jgi:hypothetical protein
MVQAAGRQGLRQFTGTPMSHSFSAGRGAGKVVLTTKTKGKMT